MMRTLLLMCTFFPLQAHAQYLVNDFDCIGGWEELPIAIDTAAGNLRQIATFSRWFGTKAEALRSASALWTTLLVPLVHRTPWYCYTEYVQRTVAFGAALLPTLSCYLPEITSGAMLTEHNDTVFFGTVAGSIWNYLEYLRNGRWKWVVPTGLFSAAAMLTKWYLGLIVFLPWTIYTVFRGPFRHELGRHPVRRGGGKAAHKGLYHQGPTGWNGADRFPDRH